ncbi:hypothetical protein D9619_004683 [Psilocybe cf. subviscida]|uniref:Uncharacterized protein n=1 Tax=Psilocybe cf. subviscida TaxID=2480587 RepID=A0A8H5BP00_9AGAR|nr:hypothetical protein D9619_004683 [Psilocybe cf. subviscida]
MAAIASSVFLPHDDMIKESLEAVADLQESGSIDDGNGGKPQYEKGVEQNVILPGQAVETEPSSPPTTTFPSDNDADDDDSPCSQVAEPLVPEQSATQAPAGPTRTPKPQKFLPSSTSPTPLMMPGLADLTDLTLHSPSSQIVGTPFATDSTRFEYPFPETAARDPSASPSPMLNSAFMAAIAQNDSQSPKIGIAFHSHAAPSPVPSATTANPSGISLASYGFPHSEINVSYNPAHPKLKQNINPPVPPSLAKKSKKWSLNLLGRRKSSSGQSSAGTAMMSEFSSNVSSPTGSVARANLILDGGLSSNSPPPASSIYSRGR